MSPPSACTRSRTKKDKEKEKVIEMEKEKEKPKSKARPKPKPRARVEIEPTMESEFNDTEPDLFELLYCYDDEEEEAGVNPRYSQCQPNDSVSTKQEPLLL